MGNILFFCGSIHEGKEDPDSGFFRIWQKELAKGFEGIGNNVFWVNLTDKHIIDSLNEAFKNKIDFAFSFVGTYEKILQLKLNDGEHVLNKLNIPLVNSFMDPVFSNNNKAVRFGGINHLLATCISEDEPDEVRFLAPYVNHTFFFPLGGTSCNKLGGGV